MLSSWPRNVDRSWPLLESQILSVRSVTAVITLRSSEDLKVHESANLLALKFHLNTSNKVPSLVFMFLTVKQTVGTKRIA